MSQQSGRGGTWTRRILAFLAGGIFPLLLLYLVPRGFVWVGAIYMMVILALAAVGCVILSVRLLRRWARK